MKGLLYAAIVLALTGLSGCGGWPTTRDDYAGRSWLEPEREIRDVARGAWGNPILPGVSGGDRPR